MQQENKNHSDEVSIREMIAALIKNWLIIVLCTGCSVLIGVVYVFFIATPVYQSSTNGVFSVPAKIESRYGTFVFPSTVMNNYISKVTSDDVLEETIDSLELDTTVEALRKKVSTATNGETGFSIIAKSDSPENAKILATRLSDVFIEKIGITYREYAVNYFLKNYNFANSTLAEKLEKANLQVSALEEELTRISPVITLKKLLANNPDTAGEIAYDRGLDLTNITDEKILYEEFINPIYSDTQAAVLKAKQVALEVEIAMGRNEILYKSLELELAGIEKYKASGDMSGLTDSSLDVLGSYITIIETARETDSPITPNKKLTLAIALVFGLMLGAAAALSKYFWKSGRKQNAS